MSVQIDRLCKKGIEVLTIWKGEGSREKVLAELEASAVDSLQVMEVNKRMFMINKLKKSLLDDPLGIMIGFSKAVATEQKKKEKEDDSSVEKV